MRSDRPPRPAESEDPRDDSEFQELLAKYVEEVQATGFVDPEEILRDHPDLGPRLLEDLETYAQFRCEDLDQMPLGTLGDYTLRRRIARGGMGIVYEAWENSMDRAVALKVLPTGVAADDRAFQRFMQEAKTAGKLSHQNIVPVYSTGIKEGTPWFSMEFVEGETLAQILARIKDPEPETETAFGKKDRPAYFEKLAEAFADVADGLQHAHSKGVTHRDIKPSNLILDGDGRLRILDFGLARLEGQESLTLSGDFVGTPLYMSPEQARRKKIPVDHRTDVYSLGATMYEALCGQPPFRGRDHADTLSQIIERDPVEPRKVNPRVPKDLETIVLKCLRKDSKNRYGTAEALGQDLRRFMRGDHIEARPQSQWERVGRAITRHRIRVLAIAVLVLFALSSSYLAYRLWKDESERTLVRYTDTVLLEKMRLLRSRMLLTSRRPNPNVPDLLPVGTFRSLATVRIGDRNPIEESIETLGEIARTLPGRAEAHYYRAIGHALLGRPERARRELEEAIQRGDFLPAHALAAELDYPQGAGNSLENALRDRISLPWHASWLDAHVAMRERRWSEAATAYGRLLELDRKHRETHGESLYLGSSLDFRLGRGLALLEAGPERLREAAVEFIVARHRWPELLEPVLLLARTYYLQDDPGEADSTLLKFYNETPRTSKDRVAAWCAVLYFWLGDLDAGLRWADRIERQADRERLVATAPVNLIGGEQAWKEAMAAAESLAALDTADTTALVWQAYEKIWQHWFRRGPQRLREIREGIRLAEQVLAKRPDDRFARGLLGLAYWALGNRDHANELLDQAGGVPRIFVWVQEGELDEIAERAERFRSVARNPKMIAFWTGIEAMLLDLEGDHEAALLQYERAESIHPFWHWIPDNAGWVRYWSGDYALASKCFARAISGRRRGHLDAAYEGLVRSLERQGRIQDAVRACSHAIETDEPPWDERPHENLLRMIRKHGESAVVPELRQLAAWLERRLAKRENDKILLGTLAFLRIHVPELRNAEGAHAFIARRITAAGRDDAELLATLAEVQHARGETERAIATLQEALGLPDARVQHRALLESLSSSGAREARVSPPGEDVEARRWVIAEIKRTGALRINCGGGEYRDESDYIWREDRFHRGGRRPFESGFDAPTRVRVRGSPDLELYGKSRFFDADGDRPGYRIPLPPGSYRIVLHFCEARARAEGINVFDVVIEGEKRLKRFDSFEEAGFGMATSRPFEGIDVTDGVLELEFHARNHVASVAAIEVATVE